MSKKILSLALAVVMLVSVFTIAASATTFPEEGQIGYRVVTDAYVGMPAGETVNVKVYFVFPDDTDFDAHRQTLGNIFLCYNQDYFSYVADSRVWGSFYEETFKASAVVKDVTSASTAPLKTVMAAFTDNDTAKGYNAGTLVQQTFLSVTEGGEWNATTGYPVDPYCEIFTIQYEVVKDLTADANIGIAEASIGKATYAKYWNTDTKKTITYATDSIVKDEFTDGAATLNVSDAQAILLRNNAADANTVDVGFIATFMDAAFAAEFAGNGTTCTNLANIGIDVRINGTVQSGVENADLNMIYPIDGGYQFVGAVTGIDADNLDTKIEARAYMIDSEGTTYYSNWIACNANLRYDDAVDAGMNAIA